jgi:carbamoyltransferase
VLICGVKATHDGGVALIENGRLLFSIEVEKLNNGHRYGALGRLGRVDEILRSEGGFNLADVDRFVVDGWEAKPGEALGTVDIEIDGIMTPLPVAPYVESGLLSDPLQRYEMVPVNFGDGVLRGYTSYHHASNHIMGAYCTSPFAKRGEDSLVVVWDGGMLPRAYHVSASDLRVKPVDLPLFPLLGHMFSDFCSHFGPFKKVDPSVVTEAMLRRHLEIAGKAMAYAALGSPSEEALSVFASLLGEMNEVSERNAFLLGEKVLANRDEFFPGLTDADIIASFQAYLGRELLASLSRLVAKHYPGQRPNLCLGGGCALNIKWNSRLRESGLFHDIWIPPFPNDSGAAIGTACCEMFKQTGISSLSWDVYSGPKIQPGITPAGWTAQACDEQGLAKVLHQTGEPVVVLSDRAEMGPRALGNRSVIAAATSPLMKDLLNDIKGREHYRPVAPICLASRAAEVFDPGTPDPYMLFEHQMRPGWADRVPAITHLDGSARLQTVDESVRSPIAAILGAYEQISGIPVLCNTSANLAGHGFFPDVQTAADWGRTRFIWSSGTLYTKSGDDQNREGV